MLEPNLCRCLSQTSVDAWAKTVTDDDDDADDDYDDDDDGDDNDINI